MAELLGRTRGLGRTDAFTFYLHLHRLLFIKTQLFLLGPDISSHCKQKIFVLLGLSDKILALNCIVKRVHEASE